MSGWRFRSGAASAAVMAGLGIAACGGGASQSAGEPAGNFPVAVSQASFPAAQRLSEHANLVIAVRNSGTQAIPDIAVTITDPPYGTAAQSFGRLLAQPSPGQPILAGRSRAVWVIDRPPGPCQYSCLQGGPGAAATSDTDTWALGRLAPGQTATFQWGVTAVASGSWNVRYVVAAGLAGKAKAVTAGGQPVTGTFHVTIASKPRQAYVNNAGQVVYSQ